MRAYVSELKADTVRYRGALAFDRLIDTEIVGYALPLSFREITDSRGNNYPTGFEPSQASHDERLTA